VHWTPVWAVLEDRFSCLLGNAWHIKQNLDPRGAKTDVLDPQWLCQLLEAGLLRRALGGDRGAARPFPPAAELLCTIPRVGGAAEVIIAETGGDMSAFPAAKHLASSPEFAPATTSRPAAALRQDAQGWFSQTLVECAKSANHSTVTLDDTGAAA